MSYSGFHIIVELRKVFAVLNKFIIYFVMSMRFHA